MRVERLLIGILLFCSATCAVPKKNDTVVVIIDKNLSFVHEVYNRDSIPCIEIQGSYLGTKKDNTEFARMYFCLFDKSKSVIRKRKFITKHCRLIKAEELFREKHFNDVVKYFPRPSGLREEVKVYIIFKEDWLNKKEVKLYPVKFEINEVQYCSV